METPDERGTPAQGNIDIKEVKEIVRNVKEGIRTKTDLRRCGCNNCREALKILNIYEVKK